LFSDNIPRNKGLKLPSQITKKESKGNETHTRYRSYWNPGSPMEHSLVESNYRMQKEYRSSDRNLYRTCPVESLHLAVWDRTQRMIKIIWIYTCTQIILTHILHQNKVGLNRRSCGEIKKIRTSLNILYFIISLNILLICHIIVYIEFYCGAILVSFLHFLLIKHSCYFQIFSVIDQYGCDYTWLFP
jgi:hypothetical protein